MVQMRIRQKELIRMCEVIIGSKIKSFLVRKNYKLKKAAIIKLQKSTRRMIVKRKYEKLRRAQMRLLVLEFSRLPLPETFPKNTLIILVVYDPITQSQLVRLDKTIERARKESFFIPGITGFMSVLMTIAVKEEYTTQYVIVAQGQLFIKDIVDFTEEKIYTVAFEAKIRVLPHDLNSNGHNLAVPNISQNLYGKYMTNNPGTTTNANGEVVVVADNPKLRTCEVLYLPQPSAFTVCAWINGPPLDTLKRDLRRKESKAVDMVNFHQPLSNFSSAFRLTAIPPSHLNFS